MSKLDYTLLFFVAVLLFGSFCLWFNAKITHSVMAKRITWYLVWGSVCTMAWLLLFILNKIVDLKGS